MVMLEYRYLLVMWRREWDSNPRLLRVTGFQDRLLKPLGHLSLPAGSGPGTVSRVTV